MRLTRCINSIPCIVQDITILPPGSPIQIELFTGEFLYLSHDKIPSIFRTKDIYSDRFYEYIEQYVNGIVMSRKITHAEINNFHPKT